MKNLKGTHRKCISCGLGEYEVLVDGVLAGFFYNFDSAKSFCDSIDESTFGYGEVLERYSLRDERDAIPPSFEVVEVFSRFFSSSVYSGSSLVDACGVYVLHSHCQNLAECYYELRRLHPARPPQVVFCSRPSSGVDCHV
jgi:hypothetical protein